MTENEKQKGTLSETLHKELRVVISGNRSPLPFRKVPEVLRELELGVGDGTSLARPHQEVAHR
jgi:hypothetical protein